MEEAQYENDARVSLSETPPPNHPPRPRKSPRFRRRRWS